MENEPMDISEIFQKLGGRKFVFAAISLLALIAGVLLVESPDLYSTFAYATVGLYTALAGGNAGEHLARALSKSREMLVDDPDKGSGE